MIELAQHIEVLLLENDCVIIPGLGGFVAHYIPAMYTEESIFFPPTRTIGFNPQLKLNDGLLVQSYMAVHDTNFPDATKIVEEEVTRLITILHKEGKADLPNVGEIRYTIYDTYDFIPYDNKITTPYLYGLDSFEMKELSALRQMEDKVLVPVTQEKKKSYEFRINRAVLRNAVAMVAAIALFFFLSTPIENTYVEKDNYAQLLPVDLFGKIEEQSVVMTPVIVKKEVEQAVKTKKQGAASSQSYSEKSTVRPVAVREVKVAKPLTENSNTPVSVDSNALQANTIATSKATVNTKQTDANFHIIVAGGIGLKDAERMAEQLRNKGFSEAKALNSDGKVRVSIMAFDTRKEAMDQLLKLRENEAYKMAWMLAK
ncbi:HU domain-containing protein [Bacteroides sp.]